jgi:hypothetical protein
MVVKGSRNVVKDPTSLKDKVNIILLREMYILKYVNMIELSNIILNV